MMQVISDDTVSRVLSWEQLIPALSDAFSRPVDLPDRGHYTTPRGTLLLMPAWRDETTTGIKIATVHPDNVSSGLPAVHALYVLLDGTTGVPSAIMQARSLTTRRTAATSALASSFLSRNDARTLLVVGAGAMAPALIAAHASVRPIESVLIWNRSPDRAHELVQSIRIPAVDCQTVDDLEAATAQADIISTATLSLVPLIRARNVQPGTHIDLVGAYRPDMRETDSSLISSARVFVDTREGALKEGGDLAIPISEGVFSASDVCADLHELCAGQHSGRATADDITVFKSVGHALEDLVAAQLVFRALS